MSQEPAGQLNLGVPVHRRFPLGWLRRALAGRFAPAPARLTCRFSARGGGPASPGFPPPRPDPWDRRGGVEGPTLHVEEDADEFILSRLRPALLDECHDTGHEVVYTSQELIEITEEGLELSAEILTDANFHKLRLLCAQVVAFTNDLFSYEKEVLVHRNPNNLLHVLMTRRSLSLEEATSQAVKIINTDVETFITYEQALLPKIERDKRVHAYLHGMKAWMRGNILWSLEIGRYSSVTSPFPELRLTSSNRIAACA